MTIFGLVGGTDVKPTAAPRTAQRLIGLASNTTSTAENGRIRAQRCDIWRAAEAATQYWRQQLKFESAISYAQRMEIPEGCSHPEVDCKDHLSIVAKWREALVRQLLTPAPMRERSRGSSRRWPAAATITAA